MNLRKYRWSRAYESAEEELVDLLAARHITATRQAVEEGKVLTIQAKPTARQLWCAEGMFTVNADGTNFSMQPGDILDIPADKSYQIVVRFGGCVYYESTVSST